MNGQRGQDPEYLGDGVYCSHDGFQIWLHVGSHDMPPVVALEPEVLTALVAYAQKIEQKKKQQQEPKKS